MKKGPATLALEEALRNRSRYDMSKIGAWDVADGGSLSELIFLIFGTNPSDALETKKWRKAFKAPMELYTLVERSIAMGYLRAKKTHKGYFIDVDEFLDWALRNGVGIPATIKRVKSARIKARPALYERSRDASNGNLSQNTPKKNMFNCARNKCQALPKADNIVLRENVEHEHESNSSLMMLTPRAQKMYEQVVNERKRVIDLCLQEIKPKSSEKMKYLGLIEEFGIVQEKDFEKYNIKGPKPPRLVEQHRCRAIARVLLFMYPDLKFNELRLHDLMVKYGHEKKKSKVVQRWFAQWMHNEGIYSHKRTVQN